MTYYKVVKQYKNGDVEAVKGLDSHTFGDCYEMAQDMENENLGDDFHYCVATCRK